MDYPQTIQPAEVPAIRHDQPVILLHWLTAALVGVLWLMGQTVDFAPSGALRVDYRSLHIMLGVMLGVVLVVRMFWRATRGGMLPPLDTGILRLAAQAVHLLLYTLLVAVIVLGLLNAWIRGDSIFTLFAIPSFAPDDRALRRTIGGYHALAANALLIVALLHAAAGLLHHYVLRDSTLRRMWPWRLP